MWLIVGLGNPGNSYKSNRHNIGFQVVDFLSIQCSSSESREKFSGLVSKAVIGGEEVILLKPQTYMNRSGISVQAASQFYKVSPENILIIHDELDLAFGDIRVKKGGGHAGHNGLKSIISHLNSNAFSRIRFGIGRPLVQNIDIASYVLSSFSTLEQVEMDSLLKEAAKKSIQVIAENSNKD